MGSLHDFPMRKGKAAAKRTAGFAELAQPFLDRDIQIFPLQHNNKNPLKGSNGYKDATTARRQIREWNKENPDSNVGIPTGGGSGFVVLDLDIKNRIDGIANFKDLCKTLGVKIPATYEIRTPSGGKHLFFRTKYATKIRNSAGKLGAGIDVRASGGYVVSECSSISGSQYTRIAGSLDDIATLPKKLRLAIQSSKAKKQPGNDRDDSIPEGTRNSKLFREACALRRIGRKRRATLKLIRTINKTECKPPLDDNEMETLVHSAFDNATQEVTTRCAADIEIRPLSPLWPGILFKRKVALVAGNPGLGKSFLCCDVAARISTAAKWPGGEAAVIPPAASVIISGEDDAEDTIVPRLNAAGADLSKIHIISDVVESQGRELAALSIDQHMQFVHSEMLKHKAVLLVIDPISAFMADRDSHKDTSVRALLNKIRQFAVEGDYAALLVSHFNKPSEKVSAAVHRVMGSLGFVAAARSVYAIIKDPQDPDKKLLLPIKNNLGPDTEGFRYRIKTDHKQKIVPRTAYLEWDKEVIEETLIDEVLSVSAHTQATEEKKTKIRKWLRKAIRPGHKMASKTFDVKRKKRGFSYGMVKKLMPDFGYKRVQQKGEHPKWDVFRAKEESTD